MLEALNEIGLTTELNELLASFQIKADSNLSLPIISKLVGKDVNKEEAMVWLQIIILKFPIQFLVRRQTLILIGINYFRRLVR